MKTALFGLAAAVLTAQLAGCATPVETPPMVVRCGMPASSARPGPALVGQTYGMAMTPLPLNSVQFGTVEASQSLSVQNLYAERSSTDVVLLSVRLVSCLDTPMAIRVRTSFMRANTSPAEEPSAWKTVYLEPRATALYRENSTSRDAAAYLIEIAK
jgi:hypothetical protein